MRRAQEHVGATAAEQAISAAAGGLSGGAILSSGELLAAAGAAKAALQGGTLWSVLRPQMEVKIEIS